MEQRRILVIAGSDSSGGAGLEADQRVIAAHKCYAMTATTALTAQNTTGVFAVHQTPPGIVKQQIDACIDDIGVDVVKMGMLASAETIDVVADAMESHGSPISVVDPVMVATSGALLLPQSAVRKVRCRLLPLSTIFTPNIPEAELLLKDIDPLGRKPIRNAEDIVRRAQAVQSLGPKYVFLKGGHVPLRADYEVATCEAERRYIFNVLCSQDQTLVYRLDYQSSRNTHGTGCSLASAIASNLATGHDMTDAVDLACRYVEAGIKLAPNLGKGSGPINHLHSVELKEYPESSLLRRAYAEL